MDMTTLSDSHSFSEANKNYFNHIAHTYDELPDALKLAHRLSQAFLAAFPFNEDSTCALDYACGTGLVSRELAPYVKTVVGVDISQGMVDQFNERVHNQGIPPEEMRAVCTTLKGEEGELEGLKFDVIVCALAYHHFQSIEEVTRALTYFLKPRGVLLVADIMKGPSVESIFPQHVHHVVPHRGGFEEAEIRTVFQSAGLVDFSFEKAATAKKQGEDVDFFIAKGVKPEE